MKTLKKTFLILVLISIAISGFSFAKEPIKYSKTLKELTIELNKISLELGGAKYSEEDLKAIIILGISENNNLSEDKYNRERLLKLSKGIMDDGKILIPIVIRQSVVDGLLYMPDTKYEIPVNPGRFTIVDLDIMDSDEIIEGSKLDWYTIRVFVKAAK